MRNSLDIDSSSKQICTHQNIQSPIFNSTYDILSHLLTLITMNTLARISLMSNLLCQSICILLSIHEYQNWKSILRQKISCSFNSPRCNKFKSLYNFFLSRFSNLYKYKRLLIKNSFCQNFQFFIHSCTEHMNYSRPRSQFINNSC